MTEEYRTWGPPGTGKTTWIADEAIKQLEIYGPDQVSICSLTNAAVEEVFSRYIPIDSENLTTLHARCKRALQAPPPADAFMKDFAAEHSSYATSKHIPIHRGNDATREESILAAGPTIYDEVQVARQRMIPVDQWRPDCQKWYRMWSRWCRDSGLMDYTSWLETVRSVRGLPSQSMVFVDEAQDHTPLQLEVLRSWDTRKLVLVGDDDQSLYEWGGVVPEEFLKSNIPGERDRTLGQSYRVPRSVHGVATDILSRISHRKPKVYNPVDLEGSTRSSNFSLSDSQEAPMPGIDDEQEHMILASCAYMLDGIVRNLINDGIPFHNPYRRSNSIWNPLQTDTATAVRSFLADEWTGQSIIQWAGIVENGVFSDRDGLLSLCANDLHHVISGGTIRPYLSEYAAENLLSRSPESLLRFRRKSLPGLWDYYVKTLGKEPKIIIGTIHSVKGGEADCVHIFPDLSVSGYTSLRYSPDSIHRLFYVAVTRAKRSIVIYSSDNYHYDYPVKRGGD